MACLSHSADVRMRESPHLWGQPGKESPWVAGSYWDTAEQGLSFSFDTSLSGAEPENDVLFPGEANLTSQNDSELET